MSRRPGARCGIDAVLAILAIGFLLVSPAYLQAQPRGAGDEQKIRVEQLFGDGKGGRVFAEWRQEVPNRAVQRVTMLVQRRSGGNDLFLSLRFGTGDMLEKGKRIFLRDGGVQNVGWEIGGVSPNGQPLVLQVTNGEIYLEAVRVVFSADAGAPDRPYGVNPNSVNPYGVNPLGSDNRSHRRDRGPQNAIPGAELQPWNDSWSSEPESRPSHNPKNSDLIGGSAEIIEQCRNMAGARRPVIEIDSVRPNGAHFTGSPYFGGQTYFSGPYEIRGTIFSSCVEEAGYYEGGTIREAFPFPLEDRARRREFVFVVEPGRRGEIRVYTVDGRQEYVSVDDTIEEARRRHFR